MNKGKGALGFWSKVSSPGKIKVTRHLREVYSQPSFSFMVSYGWLGTGFDTTATVACFLCVLPTVLWALQAGSFCSYNEMLRSLSTPSFMLWTASHLFFLFFFLILGSFNCFIPEHTRGLWWLQFWLLISCRPPFLAAFPPPVQPASATEEKTHRTFSQTRIEHLLRKHVYKAPGRDILIQGKN